jgi:hypothetical protein
MIDGLNQIRFQPRSGQTKDYAIDMSCFSAKQTVLKSKSGKAWLACESG